MAIASARPIGRSWLTAAIDGALQGAPIARGHFVVALPRNDMGKIRRNMLRRSLLTTSAESGSQQRRSGEPARGLHEPACAGTGKARVLPKTAALDIPEMPGSLGDISC